MFKRLWAEDSSSRLAILAVLVGIVAGLGAAAFRALIAFFHNALFLHIFSFQYDANLHTLPSPFGAWIILIPVVGAFAVAFLVKTFAPEAKGHGVPEVMDAMYYNRGIIRPVVAVIKALASSISIGSGGAIGREGPIIQIGAAFGSTVGQILPMRQWQRMTLISCGVGGGIAATFNTPIGGLLFAIELIMPEISARTLVPVAVATGAATFVGRFFFGDHPAFNIPALSLPGAYAITPGTALAYLAFGALLGIASVIYIRAIYGAEDFFDRMPGNYYTRHGLGMLIVGVMMYLFMHHTGHYYIQGVGYATVQDVLARTLTDPWFLLLLCACKLVATSLTLGSGASGGVFSPSLFIGATLGAAWALLISRFVPGVELSPSANAIIGMAGMVGGATGAVVTAIVMIFEMTRDYNVIIPLMITVSVAYGVRRYYLHDSIYDMKLTRRGHYIPEALQTNMYLLNKARDILRTPVMRIDLDPEMVALRRRLARHGRLPHIVVVDESKVQAVFPADRLLSMDLARGLEDLLADHGERQYIVVGADDMIFDVVARLRDANCDIALVTPKGELKSAAEILGVLTWADVAQSSNLPRTLLQRKPKTA